MASHDPIEQIVAELHDVESTILRAEQTLLGEIDAIKRRHREQQAGSPRSYDLEEAHRSLRRIAKDVAALREQREAGPRICNVCDKPILHEAVCEDCLPQRGWQREAGQPPRQDYGPSLDCPRCHGTGEASNAQFRCPCRWNPPNIPAGKQELLDEIERQRLGEAGRAEAQHRRACECAVPDPVMQADERFYCFHCSFQTGARPVFLEPENTYRKLAEAQQQIAALTAERDERARRGQIAERFQSYISTARNARRQYEAGAAESQGTERQAYLDCAHGESVKEQILRQAHASLDYDLFEAELHTLRRAETEEER